MHENNDRYVILTGGPGAGKTTLIAALKQRGYATAPEAGRAIIQNYQAIEGPALPWRDRGLFAELMLSWELRSYGAAAEQEGTVFFDRGVPDVLGYLDRSATKATRSACGSCMTILACTASSKCCADLNETARDSTRPSTSGSATFIARSRAESP